MPDKRNSEEIFKEQLAHTPELENVFHYQNNIS